jgi:hypothetical protein
VLFLLLLLCVAALFFCSTGGGAVPPPPPLDGAEAQAQAAINAAIGAATALAKKMAVQQHPQAHHAHQPPQMPFMPPALGPLAPGTSSRLGQLRGAAGEHEEAPSSKRVRMGAEGGAGGAGVGVVRVSAAEWEKAHPGLVTVVVAVVKEENQKGWALNGQHLTLEEVPVSSTVRELKQRLGALLGDMPANKQKLKHSAHGFLKDTHSLATYNLPTPLLLELASKTRGRRGK